VSTPICIHLILLGTLLDTIFSTVVTGINKCELHCLLDRTTWSWERWYI